VYHEAMTGGGETQPALVSAIATHALETQETDHPFAISLAQRVLDWTSLLAEQPDSDLLAGNLIRPS
jgi:hypothetical protein